MKRTKGFSLVELLIVIAITLLLLSVAIPGAQRMRLNAVEAVVAREVQTVHQAQIQYISQFGTYAETLASLGPSAAGLIPASLASGEKDGYLFTMTHTAGGYAISAVPKAFPSSGRRTFYLDENGILHQNWGEQPATAASPEFR